MTARELADRMVGDPEAVEAVVSARLEELDDSLEQTRWELLRARRQMRRELAERRELVQMMEQVAVS